MNNQQITKIINFFRINYQFHSPFTLLLDGNFLKLLVEKEISFEQKLASVLPGKFRLKVTSCITMELDLLGSDFKLIHQQALSYPQLNCGHSFQSADRCIQDHVKNFNNEKLIICSQDQVLRRKIRKFHVPIMYFGPDQRITMEDIGREMMKNVEGEVKEKLLPQKNQMIGIKEHQEQEAIMEKEKKKREERRMASERGIELKELKKKKVKGPNPLSIKKKKEKYNEEDENSGGQAIAKKKRIRKKKKKNVPLQ